MDSKHNIVAEYLAAQLIAAAHGGTWRSAVLLRPEIDFEV